MDPLADKVTKLMVTSNPELDHSAFATPIGDGTSAGQGLQVSRGGKTLAVIAKLGQQGRGQELTGTREGGKDELVRVLFKQSVQSFQAVFFGLNHLQQHRGQDWHFVLIGPHGFWTGCWLGML